MIGTQEDLLKILSDVLWGKTPEYEFPQQAWEDILYTAEDQGVLFLVLQGCPVIRRQVSATSWQKWRSKLLSTMIHNESILATQCKIMTYLQGAGIPCVVLKGSSLSVCYINPSARALGDIDLLIPAKKIKSASAILTSLGFHAPKDSYAHPYHIDFYQNNIVVELHYAVSTFPDSPAGKEAKQYMEAWQENIQQKHMGKYTFWCLSASRQALSLLVHMERHMTTGCIGLRQLCDWAVFLTSITPDDLAAQICPELKRCGLGQFAAVLTQTAIRYLGLNSAYGLCFPPVREHLVRAMMEEILRIGSIHNKNNTDDGSSFFVDESGTKSSMRVFICKMNALARRKFPFTQKLPFLLPLFWIYIPLRYWFRSLTGKRRRKSLLHTITITNHRKQLYRSLDLFKHISDR